MMQVDMQKYQNGEGMRAGGAGQLAGSPQAEAVVVASWPRRGNATSHLAKERIYRVLHYSKKPASLRTGPMLDLASCGSAAGYTRVKAGAAGRTSKHGLSRIQP